MASKYSIDEKKKILNSHLPFVNRMLVKVTGTLYETKWRNVKDSIVLETKLAKMSVVQVHQLNSNLMELRKKVNFKDSNSQDAVVSSKEESAAKETKMPEGSTSAQKKIKSVSSEEEKNMDLKQVLSSLKSSDEDPEKALQSLENALGRENLLKFQNLLLKDMIKKTIGQNEPSTSSSENKEDEVTSTNDNEVKNSLEIEVKTAKRLPKRKLNELDRLHRDIEEMFDREDILLSSLQPRSCTKPKITDEKYFEKFQLRKLNIKVMRLKLTRKDMPIFVDASITERELMNSRLSDLKKRKESETTVEETETSNVIPKVNPKNITKKRFRSSWSKGCIKKTKRARLDGSDDWNDEEIKDVVLSVPYEHSYKMQQFIKHMNFVSKKFENSDGIEMPEGDGSQNTVNELKGSNYKMKEVEEEATFEDSFLEELPYVALSKASTDQTKDDVINSPIMNEIGPVKIESENKTLPIIHSSYPLPSTSKSDASIQRFVKFVPGSFASYKSEAISQQKNIVKSPPMLNPNHRTFIKLTKPIASNALHKSPSFSNNPVRVFKFNTIKRIQPVPKTPEILKLTSASNSIIPNVSEPLNVIRTITIPSKSLKQLNIKPILKVDTTKDLIKLPEPESLMTKCIDKPSKPPQHPKLFIKSVASLNASVDAAKNKEISSNIAANAEAPSNALSFSNPTSSLGENLQTIDLQQAPIDELADKETITLCEESEVVENLRPWLKDSVQTDKNKSTKKKMLNQYCLAALFKCMEQSCSFFTSNKYFFQIHIDLHLKHQQSDIKTCFFCAYCPHRANTGVGLIKHIETEHQFDLYSCNSCFYRTYNEYQLFLNHQPKFHPNKSHGAIQLHQAIVKSPKSDLIFIKNCLGQFVSPFSCIIPGCKKKIYVLEAYNEHLQTHSETVVTKCLFCLKQTNPLNIFEHYFNCYGFGMFQCVYCPFGTSSLQFIDDHLSTHHPSRCPYFCERLLSTAAKNSTDQDMSSLETLTIKLMSKKVVGGVKINVTDRQMLSNANNIGRISDAVLIGHGRTDPSKFVVHET